MGELKAPGKPFDISKRAVWEAWEKVKANKGAPGVDGQSIAEQWELNRILILSRVDLISHDVRAILTGGAGTLCFIIDIHL